MPLNFETLMAEEAGSSFEASFRVLLEAAFAQGFTAGVEAADRLQKSLEDITANLQVMTKGIGVSNAVLTNTPVSAFASGIRRTIDIDSDVPVPPVQRARRGIVGATLTTVLKENPGLTVSDYERLVVEREPEISIKSVGNELRRGERDGRYRRDRPGGYHWYIAPRTRRIETEGSSTENTSVSHSDQGGDDGTHIA